MKRLVINADDFGLSSGINKGIVEAFCNKSLTSTSLMANMPGFEDAVHWAKEYQALSVGIHVNVLRGKPLSPPDKIRRLCRGEFFRGDMAVLLAQSCFQKQVLDEFERECRAQIERVQHAGIPVTHLDSEKHIHMIGPFFKIFSRLAREYGIRSVRCVNEIPYFSRSSYAIFNRQLYVAYYLSTQFAENRDVLRYNGLSSTDYFFGIVDTGRMVEKKYMQVLSCLKDGTTEIMCHPGHINNEWNVSPLLREKYYINGSREQELRALLCPQIKDAVNKYDISLIGYGDV